MLLVKETSRRVVQMDTYNGVCDSCGAPVEFLEPLVAIVVQDEGNYMKLVPVDRFSCPSCFKTLETINVYRSLDISEELAQVKP